MKTDVLLGLQWGDEGKGKIVDVLTPHYSVIARFQGGPNAGHTLEFDGQKHVLHTIPSGVFRQNCVNIIGNGVVIDPVIFERELHSIEAGGHKVRHSIQISRKAHLILPTHKLLDAASEAAKGLEKIGSTLRGIGPTYMDKTGRNGLRVGDIEAPDFADRYARLRNKHLLLLENYGYDTAGLAALEESWHTSLATLQSMKLIDSEHAIHKHLCKGERILAEGAQGSLLDIDFGSYPFVTSSNTVCAGACSGLGIAPGRIGEVFGIFKAYCTRVGSGPFPTELHDATGQLLRDQGGEYGATTGRPRRCGWLDLPALKYAIMLNGVTHLIMTKADVLSAFSEIKVCTHYLVNGERIDYMPYRIDEQTQPEYVSLPCWKDPLTGIRSEADFPETLSRYIAFIEGETGVPITIVSVGPDREQTIVRRPIFSAQTA
ncbi:MAG: adenylosuccinate synthase [Flavobacteriales bacterium]|nr:adenylosuccinate synthase [Flavobacteriales bacterium]